MRIALAGGQCAMALTSLVVEALAPHRLPSGVHSGSSTQQPSAERGVKVRVTTPARSRSGVRKEPTRSYLSAFHV